MSWLTGVLLYVILWWLVLFAVLPFGNAPAAKPEEGHAESAPARPQLGLKALVTTLLAAVLWLGAYGVIQSDILVVSDMTPEQTLSESE